LSGPAGTVGGRHDAHLQALFGGSPYITHGSALATGLPLLVHPVLMLGPHGGAELAQFLAGVLMAAAGAEPFAALLHHARGTATLAVPVLGEP
jgi:hypothetical protein